MKKAWLMTLVLLVVLGLVACGGGGEEATAPEAAAPEAAAGEGAAGGEAPPAIGDPDAGRQIYETGGESQIPCASCHTLDGTALVGPSFQGIAERAGERVPGLSAEEYIRQSILNPGAYVVEGYQNVMNNNYGDFFSEEDVNNLIAFLLSLD